MQFITYPQQQQPALAGNPGNAHAQVYQGEQKQPVFDVQPIGPTNAYDMVGLLVVCWCGVSLLFMQLLAH